MNLDDEPLPDTDPPAEGGTTEVPDRGRAARLRLISR